MTVLYIDVKVRTLDDTRNWEDIQPVTLEVCKGKTRQQTALMMDEEDVREIRYNTVGSYQGHYLQGQSGSRIKKPTGGYIDLKDGFTFYWMLGSGAPPEISGHIEKPRGGVLKGSSGWYRTDDPQNAAAAAEKLFLGAKEKI